MKIINYFKNMSKKKKIIILCSFIFLLLCCFLIFLFIRKMNKTEEKLTDFKIISFNQEIKNESKLNELTFEKSKNALKYIVYVYNSNNKFIKEVETKETSIVLSDLTVAYNDEITIKVQAVDKNKNKLKATNNLDVTWSLPSLQANEINDIGTDEDLSVRIDIDESKMEGYYLILSKGEEEIIKLEVDSSKMIIPSNYYSNSLGKYKVSLVYDDIELSSYEFTVGLPEIGEVYIDNIKHNSTIPWDDFEVSFSGGENADIYEVSVHTMDNKMVFFKQTTEMLCTINISKLQENTTYVLKVMAYNKMDNSVNNQRVLSFKTGTKEKAKEVKTDVLSGEVTIGTKITLSSETKSATIYYTIDGSTPSENSLKFDSPIEIMKDVTIKAIAISKNHFNSDVATFEYKAKTKEIKVNLRASKNEESGIIGSLYTSDKIIIGEITNIIQNELKKNNIIVILDNDSEKVDLTLTLSSTSDDGNTHGISTFVYATNSIVAPLAVKLHNGLSSIYGTNPKKLIYTNTSGNNIDEVNPKKTNNGILIRLGYRDNMQDAKWLVENKDKIALKIAEIIIKNYNK